MNRRAGFFTLLICFLLLVSLSLFLLHNLYQKTLYTPLSIDDATLFEIKSGSTVNQVARQLIELSEVDLSASFVKLWVKFENNKLTVKKGIYELHPDMTLADCFALFESGKQKQFSVPLVEGLTWKEWLHVLRSSRWLLDDWNEQKQDVLLQRASDIYQHPIDSLEGTLLADTYYFDANSTISSIVGRAFDAMLALISETSASMGWPSPLASDYEALILSSIVEKETADASERPIIAGVFINRLVKKMRLQTDPTIIYGLGDEFNGDITREHLKRPTPYNTYVIRGLPPTPICMLGRASLKAVASARQTDYLYFVSKGNGQHYFSSTLKEHNRAVRQYQLGQAN